LRFKNESFIYHASLTLQWTPLLLVVSTFAGENTHSVALGLQISTMLVTVLSPQASVKIELNTKLQNN